MSSSSPAAWSIFTAVAVAASLWSLIADAGTFDPGCCLYENATPHCRVTGNSPTCVFQFNGTFLPGQICGDDNASCREPSSSPGCCEFGTEGFCSAGVVDELICLAQGGMFVEGETCVAPMLNATTFGDGGPPVCQPLPSPTPTATGTATATATKIPDGGACVDAVDCVSGNCVDDVCCESACDGANESCNLPGLAGVCLEMSATVPTASSRALSLALAVLLAVAIVALWRRRAARTALD
jgi:hypothetical protein